MKSLNKQLSVRLRKAISLGLLVAFFAQSAIPACAQPVLMPQAGVRVNLSPAYNPAVLRGVKLYPDNPFKFDFIVDNGDSDLSAGADGRSPLHDESIKLIKYFLASLTTPDDDMWVNLSPYEQDRIVPESFGQTEMGRDLLAQDYLLKQITASIIYPEEEMGKKFWGRVYQRAYEQFGTTDVPINTFNKVWVVPGKAEVYEHEQTAVVTKTYLKVMLEEDYVALTQNTWNVGRKDVGREHESSDFFVQRPTSNVPHNADSEYSNEVNSLGAQIIREIVIPELEKEVNEGKNFVQLRQVYHSLILATWYKKKLKDSILAKVFVDKKRTKGIEITKDEGRGTWDEKSAEADPSSNVPRPTSDVTPADIYQQYLEAFKKGVYNYIKEDYDAATKEVIPRKYVSGGFEFGQRLDNAMTVTTDAAMLTPFNNPIAVEKLSVVTAGLELPGQFDNAMMSDPQVSKLEEVILKSQSRDDTATARKIFKDMRKHFKTISAYRGWLADVADFLAEGKDEIEKTNALFFYYLSSTLAFEDGAQDLRGIDFSPSVEYQDGGRKPDRLVLKKLDDEDLKLLDEWEQAALDDSTVRAVRFARKPGTYEFTIAVISEDAEGKHIEGILDLADTGRALMGRHLALAPWNRKETGERKLRGVGSVLLAGAIDDAFKRQYHGRIFAEVSPVAQPIFQDLGFVPVLEKTPFFEAFGLKGNGARIAIEKQNAFRGNAVVENQLSDRAMLVEVIQPMADGQASAEFRQVFERGRSRMVSNTADQLISAFRFSPDGTVAIALAPSRDQDGFEYNLFDLKERPKTDGRTVRITLAPDANYEKFENLTIAEMRGERGDPAEFIRAARIVNNALTADERNAVTLKLSSTFFNDMPADLPQLFSPQRTINLQTFIEKVAPVYEAALKAKGEQDGAILTGSADDRPLTEIDFLNSRIDNLPEYKKFDPSSLDFKRILDSIHQQIVWGPSISEKEFVELMRRFLTVWNAKGYGAYADPYYWLADLFTSESRSDALRLNSRYLIALAKSDLPDAWKASLYYAAANVGPHLRQSRDAHPNEILGDGRRGLVDVEIMIPHAVFMARRSIELKLKGEEPPSEMLLGFASLIDPSQYPEFSPMDILRGGVPLHAVLMNELSALNKQYPGKVVELLEIIRALSNADAAVNWRTMGWHWPWVVDPERSFDVTEDTLAVFRATEPERWDDTAKQRYLDQLQKDIEFLKQSSGQREALGVQSERLEADQAMLAKDRREVEQKVRLFNDAVNELKDNLGAIRSGQTQSLKLYNELRESLSGPAQIIGQEHRAFLSGTSPRDDDGDFEIPESDRRPINVFLDLGLYFWEQLWAGGDQSKGRLFASKENTDRLQSLLDAWNALDPEAGPHLDVPLLLNLSLAAYTDQVPRLKDFTLAEDNIRDQELLDRVVALDSILLSFHVANNFEPAGVDEPDLIALEKNIEYLSKQLDGAVPENRRKILTRSLASLLVALAGAEKNISSMLNSNPHFKAVKELLRTINQGQVNQWISELSEEEKQSAVSYRLTDQISRYNLNFWKFVSIDGIRPADLLLDFHSPRTQAILGHYESGRLNEFFVRKKEEPGFVDKFARARAFYDRWLSTPEDSAMLSASLPLLFNRDGKEFMNAVGLNEQIALVASNIRDIKGVPVQIEAMLSGSPVYLSDNGIVPVRLVGDLDVIYQIKPIGPGVTADVSEADVEGALRSKLVEMLSGKNLSIEFYKADKDMYVVPLQPLEHEFINKMSDSKKIKQYLLFEYFYGDQGDIKRTPAEEESYQKIRAEFLNAKGFSGFAWNQIKSSPRYAAINNYIDRILDDEVMSDADFYQSIRQHHRQKFIDFVRSQSTVERDERRRDDGSKKMEGGEDRAIKPSDGSRKWQVTDVSTKHDPRKFVYNVKMSGLGRLLNPQGQTQLPEYYSGSVISQENLNTYGDMSLGVILDFDDADLVAALKFMHNEIVAPNKNIDSLGLFMESHSRMEQFQGVSNVLFNGISGSSQLNISAQDLVNQSNQEPPAGYVKNNETIFRNSKSLKVQSAIFIVRAGTINFDPIFESRGLTGDYPVVLEAVAKGLPIVLVAEPGVDDATLESAKAALLRKVPGLKEVSPYRFQADKAMLGGAKRQGVAEYINEELTKGGVDNLFVGRKNFIDAIGFPQNGNMVSIGDYGDWRMGMIVASMGGQYIGFDRDNGLNRYAAQMQYDLYVMDENGGGAQTARGWFSYGSEDSQIIPNHSQDAVLSGIVTDVRVEPEDNVKIMLETLRVIKDKGKVSLIALFRFSSVEKENISAALRLYASYGFDKKVAWNPLGKKMKLESDGSLNVVEVYEINVIDQAWFDQLGHVPLDDLLNEDKAMLAHVDVQWNGERAARGIIDQSVYEQLQKTQPDILRRIEKIITGFPSVSWSRLHDGEFGYNEDKRTVRIKLEKELVINGERIDEIHVQGVLFTKEGYEEQDKYQFENKGGKEDQIRGDDFDVEGRLLLKPFEFMLMGGQLAQKAKDKYDSTVRMTREGIMRAPLAIGYLTYDSLHNLDKTEDQLGVFLYAPRKDSPERVWAMLVDNISRFKPLIEHYGKALRNAYNFQDDPSLANITVDLSGRQEPIYHDLGGTQFRIDLSPKQAFAYRFLSFMHGYARALEFMQQNDEQRLSMAMEMTGNLAYIAYLRGYFFDKLSDPRLKTGTGRLMHSLEGAERELEFKDLVRRYFHLEKFGSIDLAVDTGLRQKAEDVIPVHWRSMVPFLSLLYEIEQNEQEFQPEYVNLALAQSYERLQKGADIQTESLEVLHQIFLLGVEDLKNIGTAIDILKAAQIPEYQKTINLLERHVSTNRSKLFIRIQGELPEYAVEPHQIRNILRKPKTSLDSEQMAKIRKPELSLDYFEAKQDQKIARLKNFIRGIQADQQVLEQKLSLQFELPLRVVHQVLQEPELKMTVIAEIPGGWSLRTDRAMLGEEPIVFNVGLLSQGFQTMFQGRLAHARGIGFDAQRIRNYIAVLRAQRERKMITPVYRVYLPTRLLDIEGTVRSSGLVFHERPATDNAVETYATLRAARDEGLIDLVEISGEEGYRQMAKELNLDPETTVNRYSQTSSVMFVSEWVDGPNLKSYLYAQSENPANQRSAGQQLGETLKNLHHYNFIAGDTYLEQFVVRQSQDTSPQEVLRIDLTNIYTTADSGASSQDIAAEYYELATGLAQLSRAALEGFQKAYPESDLAAAKDEAKGEDQAMMGMDAVKKVGGIDFTRDKIDLEVNSPSTRPGGLAQDELFKFNFDPAQIENMDIEGFVPVIINVAPVSDLFLLLGIKEEENEERLAMT